MTEATDGHRWLSVSLWVSGHGCVQTARTFAVEGVFICDSFANRPVCMRKRRSVHARNESGRPGEFDAESSSSDDEEHGYATVSLVAAAAAAAASSQRTKRRKRGLSAVTYDDIEVESSFESSRTDHAPSAGAGADHSDCGGSRYIQKLVKQASSRRQAAEEANERKLAKEREQDAHLYPEKESFVTDAYKSKLAAQLAEKGVDDEPSSRRDISAAEAAHPTEFGLRLLHSQSHPNVQASGVACRSFSHTQKKAERNSEKESKSIRNGAAKDKRADNNYLVSEDENRRSSTEVRTEKPSDLQQDQDVAGSAVPDWSPVNKCDASRREKATVRGLRRNDAASIEAYRQRYFARLEARAKVKAMQSKES